MAGLSFLFFVKVRPFSFSFSPGKKGKSQGPSPGGPGDCMNVFLSTNLCVIDSKSICCTFTFNSRWRDWEHGLCHLLTWLEETYPRGHPSTAQRDLWIPPTFWEVSGWSPQSRRTAPSVSGKSDPHRDTRHFREQQTRPGIPRIQSASMVRGARRCRHLDCGARPRGRRRNPGGRV